MNEGPRPVEWLLEQSEGQAKPGRSVRSWHHSGQSQTLYSASPTVLLRVNGGSFHMNRAFSDYNQAVRSAEAYAGAGFTVAMMSATGRFLMQFHPRWPGMAV